MTETLTLDIDRGNAVDEDAKLVLAAQENAAEFKQLYLKWLKPVYRYFFFRVGNEKDAEDLTSQVFLKIYEDLPRYRNKGCFSAWLFTIAHSRAVDFYRKGGREVDLEQAENLSSSTDLLSHATRKNEIEEILLLLKGLDADDQELIRLRFVANLNYREIGQILNRREDAVRKSVFRLLNRMQSQLEANQ